MDASKRYRREEPKTLLQKAEEEMIYELLVAGAFALATLRRCVYIAKFYFHFLSTLLTLFAYSSLYVSRETEIYFRSAIESRQRNSRSCDTKKKNNLEIEQ